VKSLINVFLAFLVFLSIVFQSLSFYIPFLDEESSKIVLIEFEEENEDTENETNDEEKLKNDWNHILISPQIYIESSHSICDKSLFDYRSPTLSFLSPPPEKLS
jgi:hypothetical protein